MSGLVPCRRSSHKTQVPPLGERTPKLAAAKRWDEVDELIGDGKWEATGPLGDDEHSGIALASNRLHAEAAHPDPLVQSPPEDGLDSQNGLQ